MRIEEVEALADKFLDEEIFQDRYYAAQFLWSGFEQTIEALRSEAWHPIERAEEMGVKDGDTVLGYGDWGGVIEWFTMIWEGTFWTSSGDFVTPTHFKIISPPEVN